jgi:cytochrome c oxidase subunit 1
MLLGFNLTFIPLFFAGVLGMNRRINTYQPDLEGYNGFATVAGLALALVFLIFVGNMVWSWARGRVAGANPWRATTLEWQTPSPPPHENFEQIPEVVGDPYPYGEQGAQHVRLRPTAAPAGGGK